MVKSGKNVPKFIINTVCPNYKSQNLEHILEDIFIKILGMVHQNDQTKSIAIPLLGTGKRKIHSNKISNF
jgi:O-acetyl-ADP-ribose deacetylase (regulator of RNase III)